MTGVVLSALARFAARYWYWLALAAVIVYAVYVWNDRADAKAAAAHWQDVAEMRADKVEALTASYEKIQSVMADRAQRYREIQGRVDDLKAAIEVANANPDTAYGACAQVPLAPGIQESLNLILQGDSNAQ